VAGLVVARADGLGWELAAGADIVPAGEGLAGAASPPPPCAQPITRSAIAESAATHRGFNKMLHSLASIKLHFGG
jgi:hypothetical protein